MLLATIVIGTVLALMFLGSGGAKLVGIPAMRASAHHLRLPYSLYRWIGALEIAGAVGLVFGLLNVGGVAIGIAAAGGIALLMLGAVGMHIRAGDRLGQWSPPLVFAIVAGTYIALLSVKT